MAASERGIDARRPRRLRGLGPAAIAALALALAAGALAASGTSRSVVAVAVNPPANAPGSHRGIDVALAGGARGTFHSVTWARLEPAPRRYDRAAMSEIAYLSRARGLQVLLGLQVVNTTGREMPRDLAGLPFDSPRVRERFHDLVDELEPYLNANVRYLSVGNEVDIYLARRPGEWASYGRFYADAAAHIRRVAPWIEVGVTTTFSGAVRKQRRKVAELNRSSDVSIHTYYAVHGEFAAHPPSVAGTDIKRLVRLSGRRPVVFQEVGYPASPVLGGSEAKQAKFVANVFAAWRGAAARIPFLNFLPLHDLSGEACAEIAAYYGRAGAEKLKAFLCSLGLRRADGSPKPAWREFVQGAATIR